MRHASIGAFLLRIELFERSTDLAHFDSTSLSYYLSLVKLSYNFVSQKGRIILILFFSLSIILFYCSGSVKSTLMSIIFAAVSHLSSTPAGLFVVAHTFSTNVYVHDVRTLVELGNPAGTVVDIRSRSTTATQHRALLSHYMYLNVYCLYLL
jgi:hypothetical protein